MLTSFYSGLTGLSAYAGALNIVGNNLANINTTGFKTSYVNFHDMVTSTFGGISTSGSGNPMQVGLGVLTGAIGGIFSQGSIQNTAETTNMAIEGNGFFIVGDTPESPVYTRSGNFSFNREGYLVNPAGKYLLGYTQRDANGDIIASGALDRINLPASTLSDPRASTTFRTAMNLDPRTPTGNTFTSSVTVYDSLGAAHTLNIVFTKQAGAGAWQYQMYLPGADVTGGTAGTPFPIAGATGAVQFDANGVLTAPAADVAVTTPTFTNGAAALALSWDVWDTTTATPSPFLTGYSAPSAVSSTYSDGYSAGTLNSIIISKEGIIQGVFSNGQVSPLAQVALATFNNNNGLLRLGGNLYSETNASGTPAVGIPATGGRGVITGSAVEASNVDIATEFTNMLVFQRGYQANSRIITTSDEVIQEALAIKR